MAVGDSYFKEHPKGALLKDVTRIVDTFNGLGILHNELQDEIVKAQATLEQTQSQVETTTKRLTELNAEESKIDEYLQSRRKELEDEYLAKHSETQNQIREDRLKLAAAQNDLNVQRIGVQNEAIKLRQERTELATRIAELSKREDGLAEREKDLERDLAATDKREVELAEREGRLEDGLVALKEQQELVAQLKADRDAVNAKLKEAEDLLTDAQIRQNRAAAVQRRTETDRKVVEARYVELDKLGKALKKKQIALDDRESVQLSYSGAA